MILIPNELIISFGDLHIYKNHFEQVKLQLTRSPKKLPDLFIGSDCKQLDCIDPDLITIENYNPDAAIKAPVAV